MNNVNKTTRGKVSKEDLAYIAGLIDGEGSIVITKARRSNPKYKCPHYILLVTCTNTHLGVLEWLNTKYASSKAFRKREREGWRTAYEWHSSAKMALGFLKLIRPWLKIKSEQADLAIEFQTNKMSDRSFTSSGKKNGNTLSLETLKKREIVYQKMHFLNTGGKYTRGKKKPPAETK